MKTRPSCSPSPRLSLSFHQGCGPSAPGVFSPQALTTSKLTHANTRSHALTTPRPYLTVQFWGARLSGRGRQVFWVISLAGIFCLEVTKRKRWPKQDPGKLGHSLSPPPFGFSSRGLSWGRAINRQVCGVGRGRSKKKLAPSPLSCRASSEMIWSLVAQRTNSSPHSTSLTDLPSSKGCPLPL